MESGPTGPSAPQVAHFVAHAVSLFSLVLCILVPSACFLLGYSSSRCPCLQVKQFTASGPRAVRPGAMAK